MREALAGGIAHRINTPLGVALANLSLALDQVRERSAQEGDEDLLAVLQDAFAGARGVQRVVGEWTASSRRDGHANRDLDVRAALDALLSERGGLSPGTVRVVRDYDLVPDIHVDEALLLDLLEEVVAGATRRAMAQSSPLVTYRVCHGPLGRVVLEVTTVDGVDPEQVDLAARAQELSASFEVETAAGSRIVRLGFARAPQPAEPTYQATGPAEPSPRRACVWVIDDEGLMTKVSQRILAAEHDVVCFDQASQALRDLDEGAAPDLILCDLMMPEMSGMDFHAILSVHHPELAAGVIFVTGGAATPLARQFLQGVPNARLAKPFTAALLRRVVHAQLERRGIPQASTATKRT